MKKSLLLPAALLAGVAWAGPATLAAPEIRDGNTTGDSILTLDCNEPQSDSVFIWKCDSVFVEDSIAMAQNQSDAPSGEDPSWADAQSDLTHAPTHVVVRERKVSGWELFFWGFLEAVASSDNGDTRCSKSESHSVKISKHKTERPARERGSRRR